MVYLVIPVHLYSNLKAEVISNFELLELYTISILLFHIGSTTCAFKLYLNVEEYTKILEECVTLV